MADNDSKELTKLLENFEEIIKSKGPIKGWTDSYLLKARDKYRKAAVKNRGRWSFGFYECLQELNKESIKRNLFLGTEH
jgi:hypothetical protein